LAHRMRNLAVKMPEDVWPEFKVRCPQQSVGYIPKRDLRWIPTN